MMQQRLLGRRCFMKSVGLGLFYIGSFRSSSFGQTNDLPAIRTITRGPKFHWRGYYDKMLFDRSNRFVLANEVDFEGRSPKPDDRINIGMIDLQDGDRWIELGSTTAWNWQQGCMLQWVPGSTEEIIWNDLQGDSFVCHIFNVKSGKKRTLPHPIYCVSPDGKWAVSPDFRRLNDTRPGYGYCGLPDPRRNVLAPEDTGIWKIDLQSGKQTLIISYAEAASIDYAKGFPPGAKHWFNHLLFNTDGTRFLFLHRWRGKNEPMTQWGTRMFTANLDGSEKYILDPHGQTSHFIWRDPLHVTAWAWHPSHGNRFYLYKDRTDQVEVVGVKIMTVNGHNTYLPEKNNEWILNDTYPDSKGNQNVYLYHVPTNRRVWLGHFQVPAGYKGEWRCDTHPSASRDGKLVAIDSTHGGYGRQVYVINIDGLI